MEFAPKRKASTDETLKATVEPLPPNVERVLAQVDFKELHAVYKDIARKCGIDPEQLGFVPKERVHGMPPLPHPFANYESGGEYVSDPNEPSRIALPEYRNQEAPWVLGVLCHEEGHAVTRTEHLQRRTAGGAEIRESVYGLDRTTTIAPARGPELFHRVGTLLNEAVIDTLGKRAFGEYLKRRPTKWGPLNQLQMQEEDYIPGYHRAHAMFDALADRLAQECDVPKDVIVNGFIRGAFEGLNLASGEGRAVLEESVSPLFAELIMSADPVERSDISYAAARAELARVNWTDKLKERWLKLVGDGAAA